MAVSDELRKKVSAVIMGRLALGEVRADTEGGLYDQFTPEGDDVLQVVGMTCSKKQFASILSELVRSERIIRSRSCVEGLSRPMPKIVLSWGKN